MSLTMPRRKWTTNDTGADASPQQDTATLAQRDGSFPMSAYPPYEPLKRTGERAGEHVPHALCMIQISWIPVCWLTLSKTKT